MNGVAPFSRAFAGLVIAYLVAPLLLCVLFSFTSRSIASFPIEGLTLDWYRDVAGQGPFWAAAWTTAQITLGCAVTATAIGFCAALGLVRMPRRWALALLLALSFPLMLPPLVLGLSLLTFFTSVGLKPGVAATVLAHLVFTLPFVTAVIYARLVTLDHASVEAARDLGATPRGAFLAVTLPAIGASLVGSLLIAMALSLDDFVIAFFTTSSNTLSTYIWGMMRTSITPAINVVGTGIICITLGITAVALRMTRYRG